MSMTTADIELGGGQPTDTGRLSLLDPNGGIERTWVVEGCLRRKLTAVHLVRLDEGEAIESGREVELSIDWDRRSDHVRLRCSHCSRRLGEPEEIDEDSR